MKELLKKKSVKISLLLIILLVIMGIVSINARSAQKSREYNAHIEAAEKYLSDLDYEQAIAEYTMAFEIEPKEEVVDALEQTYLAYAQTCIDAGDYEKAVGILEEGYEKIGRESLQEMIEELQTTIEEQQEIMEETAQDEEIKQLVESDEFQEKITEILKIGPYQHITDEQLKELCWSLIEALEKYRKLHRENWQLFYRLPELYLLVGEFELCEEIRKELYELYPENLWYFSSDSEYTHDDMYEMFDKYGRRVTYTYEVEDSSHEINYEYGENGKVVKQTGWLDLGDGTSTVSHVYEYDSEGRLSRYIWSENIILADGSVINSERTITYTYGGKGFTQHLSEESTYNGERTIVRSTTDYEIIDEYGNYEQIGEPYDVYREVN
ncbi:MAG: hypothetical protein HDR30_02475 [Lachnospiraceae bacterium]|nr:hypothetical protein [Lachnospiraceae bacterium]